MTTTQQCVEQSALMMRVLVLNTGSSSLKWTLLAADKTVLDGGSKPWAGKDSAARTSQLRAALARAPTFDAVGHRVVHGGTRFREAVVIGGSVREELAGLADLDPEHMHASLAGIDAVSAALVPTRSRSAGEERRDDRRASRDSA